MPPPVATPGYGPGGDPEFTGKYTTPLGPGEITEIVLLVHLNGLDYECALSWFPGVETVDLLVSARAAVNRRVGVELFATGDDFVVTLSGSAVVLNGCVPNGTRLRVQVPGMLPVPPALSPHNSVAATGGGRSRTDDPGEASAEDDAHGADFPLAASADTLRLCARIKRHMDMGHHSDPGIRDDVDRAFDELQKLYGDSFENAPFMNGADPELKEYDAAFVVAMHAHVKKDDQSDTVHDVIVEWRQHVVSVNHRNKYTKDFPSTAWALDRPHSKYKAPRSAVELADDLVDTVKAASTYCLQSYNEVIARYLISVGDHANDVGDLSARVFATYTYLANPERMAAPSDASHPVVRAFEAAKRMSFVPESETLLFLTFTNAHMALVAPGHEASRVFIRNQGRLVYIYDTGHRIDAIEDAVTALLASYVTQDGIHGLDTGDCIAATLIATKTMALAMFVTGEGAAAGAAACRAETTPSEIQGWHSSPWNKGCEAQRRRFVDPVQDCNVGIDASLAPSDASTLLAVAMTTEECMAASIDTADLQECHAGVYIVPVHCYLGKQQQRYRVRGQNGRTVLEKKFEDMNSTQFRKFVMQLTPPEKAVDDGGAGEDGRGDGDGGAGAGPSPGERTEARPTRAASKRKPSPGDPTESRPTRAASKRKTGGGATAADTHATLGETQDSKPAKSGADAQCDDDDISCVVCKTTDGTKSILMCDGLSADSPCYVAMCVGCTGRAKPGKHTPFFCPSGCELHIIAARAVMNAHFDHRMEDAGKSQKQVFAEIRAMLADTGLTLSDTTLSRWLKWNVSMPPPISSSRNAAAPGSKATNHTMLALVASRFPGALAEYYASM
uniref:Uncharacterized protein n=1 Tax=viral metagenome TaxID=1070528 RepID=A0A6C0KDI9_9ZZZZ